MKASESVDSWPFIPDHISNDRHDEGLTGTGIIPNPELAGLQMLLCARLQRATTICEFYSGNSTRTDAQVSRFNWIGTCSYFREGKCNDILCTRLDSRVGERFAGKRRQDFRALEHLKAIEEPLPFFNPHCAPPRLEYINERPFLYYDCPFVGYRECVFPIFYENRTIAVLFLGQIPLIDSKRTIQDAREYAFSVLLPEHGIPDAAISEMKTKVDAADRRVWTGDDRRNNDGNKSPLSQEQYIALLQLAHQELLQFESRLAERVSESQRGFALATVNRHVAELRHTLPTQVRIASPNPLSALWEGVESAFNHLCSTFSFRYIALFGNDNPLRANSLVLLAYSNNPHDIEKYARPQGKVHLVSDKNQLTENMGQEEWLKLLPKTWPGGAIPSQTSIFSQLVPFHQQERLLFVIGHSPTLAPANFPSLEEAITSFGVTLVALLTAALESLTEQKTRTTFRVIGHELKNETDGLTRLVSNYMGNDTKFQQLDRHKRLQVLGNIQTYVKHLNLLFGGTRSLVEILGGTYELRPSLNFVYGPLIHKWKDFYRAELDKNGRDMPLVPIGAEIEDSEGLRPKCWGDIGLLELMVYNLLGNAEKYGYEGSILHADSYLDGKKNEYVFRVVDYGRPMPQDDEGEKCYELFGRGTPVKGTEGIGVGLALARAIAESHKGTLSHTCQHISRFHVPFLLFYMNTCRYSHNMNRDFLKGRQFALLAAETERLIRSRIAYKIVARKLLGSRRQEQSDYTPLLSECEQLMFQPTYEVSFEARIPQPLKKEG